MDQSVYDSMDYLPFGEQVEGDTEATHKFAGYERDSESNLDYALFRHYSSAQGRFMQPDPYNAGADVTNPQSWNAYAYVLNNPLSFVDPSGLECVWDDGSFDSKDDPKTGTESGCESEGGNWVDPAFFLDFALGDWSGSADGGLATIANALQNGFSLNQTGTGFNSWTLQSNGYDPFAALVALQQQNYLNTIQNMQAAPTDQQKLFTLQVAGMEASHDLGCVEHAAAGEIPFVGHFIKNPATPADSAATPFGDAGEAQIVLSLSGKLPTVENLLGKLGPLGSVVGGVNAGLQATACFDQHP